MLFKGPRIDFQWVTPVLIVLVVVVSISVKWLKPLSTFQFVGLLANLVGTVLLASAFEPQIPPYGKSWWDGIKSAVSEFPKYGAPPAFDFVRFYLGLLLLLIGTILSVIIH